MHWSEGSATPRDDMPRTLRRCVVAAAAAAVTQSAFAVASVTQSSLAAAAIALPSLASTPIAAAAIAATAIPPASQPASTKPVPAEPPSAIAVSTFAAAASTLAAAAPAFALPAASLAVPSAFAQPTATMCAWSAILFPVCVHVTSTDCQREPVHVAVVLRKPCCSLATYFAWLATKLIIHNKRCGDVDWSAYSGVRTVERLGLGASAVVKMLSLECCVCRPW